jgi:hypothetical protein
MARIDDWLSAIPSKYTRRIYKIGIKKFEEFYRKPIEDVLNLSDEETGHIIEKFYAWLEDRGHGQNTCRNLINSPLEYLKHFGKNPNYRKKDWNVSDRFEHKRLHDHNYRSPIDGKIRRHQRTSSS